MSVDELADRAAHKAATFAAWGFLGLVGVLLALLVAGCSDSSITGPGPGVTPPPVGVCPFVFNCTPIAGFPAIYSCAPEPAGPVTANVNGTELALEFGQLLFAASGDLVQACRPCGCTRVATLR